MPTCFGPARFRPLAAKRAGLAGNQSRITRVRSRRGPVTVKERRRKYRAAQNSTVGGGGGRDGLGPKSRVSQRTVLDIHVAWADSGACRWSPGLAQAICQRRRSSQQKETKRKPQKKKKKKANPQPTPPGPNKKPPPPTPPPKQCEIAPFPLPVPVPFWCPVGLYCPTGRLAPFRARARVRGSRSYQRRRVGGPGIYGVLTRDHAAQGGREPPKKKKPRATSWTDCKEWPPICEETVMVHTDALELRARFGGSPG